MWNRDFPGIYEALNNDWPKHLKPIMDAVLGNYSSEPVAIKKFCQLELEHVLVVACSYTYVDTHAQTDGNNPL